MSKVLTTRQAAERLGATPKAVGDWVKAGEFPNAYRLNPGAPKSPFRIPVKDIEDFEQRRRVIQPEAA